MAQKSDAQTAVEVSAFDETRNVGDGEAGASFLLFWRWLGDDHAAVLLIPGLFEGLLDGGDSRSATVVVENYGTDVGLEGGEGPVTDSRPRPATGDSTKKSALAGVG